MEHLDKRETVLEGDESGEYDGVACAKGVSASFLDAKGDSGTH